MRVVALVSGGKDSCYNMMQCVAEGHNIVALANLYPKGKDELDSYMYQTVGHMGIETIAEAMELPLFRRETKGKSDQTDKYYVPQANDEVEDLYDLLTQVKNQLDFDAISVGAILSDYQRVRVENVCSRLNLVSLAYLWQRDQTELLQEMIDSQMHAIIIKVASLGLVPNLHLGLSLSEIQPHLLKMKEKFGLNVCGEGGEYESFTLDCPLYKKRIVIDNTQQVVSNSDQVGYINFLKLRLVEKTDDQKEIRVRSSLDYLSDIYEEIEEKASEDGDESNQKQADEMLVHREMKLSPNAFAKCIASMEDTDEIPMPQNRPNAVRSNVGWLWVGGVQGFGIDIEMAVNSALQDLEDTLSENNLSLRDLVSINLYVSNMDEYPTINAVYISRLGFPHPPVRVCVGIPLPKNCPILLDALAFRGRSQISEQVENSQRTQEDYELKRQTLHVQGMSHWAPANIGPYSQSIRIGDIIYVSGQIPLIPGTMQVIEGGIVPQCKLSLRHMKRIARAMNAHGELRDVVQGTCFLTNVNNVEIARKEWEYCTTNAIIDYVIVKSLPRQSLVEWQVWIHKHNDNFEYEETGCSIDDFTISIRRRWNYENNCAAIVCNISSRKDWNCYYSSAKTPQSEDEAPELMNSLREFSFSRKVFVQILKYVLSKLLEGYPKENTSSTSDKENHSEAFNYKRKLSASVSTPSTVYLKVFYHVHLTRKLPDFPTFVVDTLNSFKAGCSAVHTPSSEALPLIPNTNNDAANSSELKSHVKLSFTAVPVYGLCNQFTFLSINGIRHD